MMRRWHSLALTVLSLPPWVVGQSQTIAPTTATPTASPSRGCFGSGFFEIVESIPEGACVTSNNATCVTDGASLYGNNERCTIRVLKTIPLDVREFSTESSRDHLTVGGTSFSGTSNPGGRTVTEGETITWSTDTSVVRDGWTICADPYESCYPTPAPTAPTEAPTTLAPTTTPTASPTGGCFASGFFEIVESFPNGACETTLNATCITDGTGVYSDNERCTIRVLKTIPLDVREFSTESNRDRLTVGGTSFSGTSNPGGRTVTEGETITWSTDTSVVRDGWTICADPYESCYPTPAPTAPTEAPTTLAPTTTPTASPTGGCFASGFFEVSPLGGPCITTQNATCVTDGPGDYGNNERCTIRVLKTIPLDVREWNTETTHDRLTIGGTSFSGSNTPNGRVVTEGETLTWSTDGTVVQAGWTICADPYESCYPTPAPTAPTASPTFAPTAVPTTTPTASPTGGCFASGFFEVSPLGGPCIT
eukprot:CAMPEP_0206307582 /NCGR_PEP_ID=MMETSP0106_2-20121207/11408_1 /ASSEMBLY_ACC=CAM_ASM_000206 /TAXON_ID=81532 /ORGANISM="Acanthoeca-like sp., Strain 10tr" /LENGTH=479 /DNA_ID=CAMNT_0053738575 /DNA_START=320 /DNA_END=1756 /DNA_ORIENTATION=+